VSQSERTGVPTPDSADLSTGGHKIARGGSRCSRDNQADGEGSPTDTDTRETLSMSHTRGRRERRGWPLGDKDVGIV
jgi:hypothetical protein